MSFLIEAIKRRSLLKSPTKEDYSALSTSNSSSSFAAPPDDKEEDTISDMSAFLEMYLPAVLSALILNYLNGVGMEVMPCRVWSLPFKDKPYELTAMPRQNEPNGLASDGVHLFVACNDTILSYSLEQLQQQPEDQESKKLEPEGSSVSHVDAVGLALTKNQLYFGAENGGFASVPTSVSSGLSSDVQVLFQIPGPLSAITGLKIEPAHDTIYLTQFDKSTVFLYNFKGKLKKEFGSYTGYDKRQFAHPRGLCLVRNRLYVCDSGHNRVSILDAQNGIYLGEWEEIYRPASICYSRPFFFVGAEDAVMRVDREGNFKQVVGKKEGWRDDEWRGVSGLCVVKDFLYASDRGNRRIKVYRLVYT